MDQVVSGMIDPEDAREIARATLRSALGNNDASFVVWPDLSMAAARLIHDVSGDPSYWIVPLLSAGYPVGFARVRSDGRVAAIGLTCQTPEAPAKCPEPVFSQSRQAVAKRARADVLLEPGETMSEPMLVHDGPPGREVWLSETRRDDRPLRWVFIGPGGTYERAAGARHPGCPGIE